MKANLKKIKKKMLTKVKLIEKALIKIKYSPITNINSQRDFVQIKMKTFNKRKHHLVTGK
jgi:hypothetical protein